MAILESTGFLHFISSCVKQGEEYIEHFRSGFNGYGWKLWETKANRFKLEIDDLTVRGTMSIYEMLIHKMRAVRGYLGLTQASGKIKSVSDTLDGLSYQIGLEEDIASLEPLDHVRCIAGTRSYWVTIGSISTIEGTNYINIAKTEFEDGMVPLVGDELIQFGTADITRTERQSAIMLHVDGETGDPAIDVMYGITEKNFSNCIKIRLGSGIDGNTAYSGLYCVNGLLKSVNDTNVEMYRFNPDGSGHIAQGNISWGPDGKVLFSDSVILQWTEAASETLSQEMSDRINALTIVNPNLLTSSDKFTVPTITGSGVTATQNESSMTIEISENGAKEITGLLQNSLFDSSLMTDERITISFKIKSENSTQVPKLKFDSELIDITGSISENYSTVYCNATYTAGTHDIGLAFTDAIGTFEITEFKVERGEKATEWSPNVKDITSRLTKIDSTGIYTGTLKAQQVNAVEIDANSIKTGELNANLIKAGSLNGDRIMVDSLDGKTIKADTLDGNTIKANTLHGNTIKAGTIEAASIKTGDITSLGNITSGTFSLASGQFSVNANGKLIAKDAEITGKITSSSGTIGIWSLNQYAIFTGTYVNTGFTSNASSITIGSNGIRGYKWQLNTDGSAKFAQDKALFNADGSGSLAGGKITWNASGIVSFDSSVQLTFRNFIEVGGRNLLTNSNQYNPSIESGTGITCTLESGAIKVVSVANNGDYVRSILLSPVFVNADLKNGDPITISFKVKSTGATTCPKFFLKDDMGYYAMTGTVSTSYSTVYVTVPYVVNAAGMAMRLGFADAIGTYYIKEFKIERGNKATDWTAAPEDTAKYLTKIDATGIYTGTITASQISAGTIDAARITAVGAVTAGSFNIGSGKFKVSSAGILEAVDVILTGKINATSGAIAGWNISENNLYTGTLATSGYTNNGSSLTIGTTGIRGFKWQLNTDGSGYLANGKISWDTTGAITFGSEVVLQWSNLSSDTQTNLKGETGASGARTFKSIVFIRSNTTPTLPTGGTFDSPVPTSWSDGVPSGTEKLWMSTRIFTSDGLAPQQSAWTTPREATSTANLEIQYSSVAISPSTPLTTPANWSTTASTSSIWQATRIISNGVAGSWQVVKVKGETGNDGTSIIWKGSLSSHPTSPSNGWAYYNTTDGQSYVYQGGWSIMSKDAVVYVIEPDVNIVKRNAAGLCTPSSVGFKVYQIKGGKKTEIDYYYKGSYASTAAAVTALGAPSAGWWIIVGAVNYRYDGEAWTAFTPVDTNLSLKMRVIVNDDFGWGNTFGPYPFVTGKVAIPAARNVIDAEVYLNAGGWTEAERLAKVRVVVVDDGAKGDKGEDKNLLPWVSEWDGHTTTINGESVISPKIFSGSKDANNLLTGVAIGRAIQVTPTETKTGVFGISQGVITFALDSTTGAITSTLGTIGGWTIGSGYLEIKNTSTNHWLRLNSSGYIYNRVINGSTDFWSLKEDGGATFSQGKVLFNSDGSGSIASGKIAWSSAGAVTLDSSLIANSIATDALTVGKFKVSKTGILEATDAILSGTITATAGAIGGFTIGTNQIGAVSTSQAIIGSSSGLSLYAGFIKFADSSRWASIGLNVLPSSSGSVGVGRFQNHYLDSNETNRGVEISVMNGGYNIALHTIGNVVVNGLMTAYQPNIITTEAGLVSYSQMRYGNTFLLNVKTSGSGVKFPTRYDIVGQLGISELTPFSVKVTYIGLAGNTYNCDLWGFNNSTVEGMNNNSYPSRRDSTGTIDTNPVVIGKGDVVEFQLVWDGTNYDAYLIGSQK